MERPGTVLYRENCTPATLNVTYGQPIGTLPVPVKEGYTFGGWVDGEGNPVTAETVFTGTEDLVLTAVWTVNDYTVTLDANGGEVEPASITVTYGTACGELPVPTRDGFIFGGWKDANGKLVTAETVYTVAGDSELTASWTEKDSGSSDTGDMAPVVLMTGLMIASAAAMAGLVLLRRENGYSGIS